MANPGVPSTAVPTPSPLIITKLAAPQLRAGLVARPRLLNLLSEGSQRLLTLVCAPAGYGKTTLLAEWIAALAKPGSTPRPNLCWLSLDEGDNDPALFLNYLAAAFEHGGVPLRGEIHAMLRAFPLPPVQAVLGALINSLHELTAPTWLVLDDYQRIENPAIHEALAFFLDRLPSTAHLVIATRSDPPLPLARLRARNQLREVRADALCFTPQEAADFLVQVMHLPVTPEDIAALETRTEGWIAGLQMAALSMQGRADITRFIQGFSGSHRYILDYLAEEVLNRLPEGERNFLIATSILERFCAPLCNAVLAQPDIDSQEILTSLERGNLFVIALDDDRRWYRYHHLFADLLRARLRQAQPEAMPGLHLRASAWYDQHGFAAEAIRHSLAAEDYDRTATLFARYASSDPSTLQTVLQLPVELVITRPRLGLLQAWVLVNQGQSGAALHQLRQVKARLSAENPSSDQEWVLAVIDLLIAFATPPTPGAPAGPLPEYRRIESIPEEGLGLRNIADYLYAILLNRQAAFRRASDILRALLLRARAGNGVMVTSLAVSLLARNLMMLGRLPDAAALCREYLELAQGGDTAYSSGSLRIILGEVLYEWNDLENAELQVRAGIQANAAWQNLVMDAIGYSDLVGVFSARGELAKATETMRQLDLMLAGRAETPDVEEELETIQVRLWLANGDQARVDAWADQVSASIPPDYLQGWRHLTLARVRAAQGRFGEAQRILETLSRQPGADQRVHRQVRIDLMLAILHHRQNRPERAFQSLEACLAQAQPGRYCRLLLDQGEPARALLQAYLRSPAPKHFDYAQSLLQAFPAAPPQAAGPDDQAGLIESLTPRELEVLRLMAAGLSNREIAAKLVLSEGTVKFHVHSILEKLAVHSRTQAILQARELRLA